MNIRMLCALLVVLASGPVFGADEVVPEFVCSPNRTRWTDATQSRDMFASEVLDLHVHNGRIYCAGGDWGANKGPVPVFAIDPATGSFTNEFTAGTDMISDFKTFSDGRLWAGAVDKKEYDPNVGHFFRRELDGTWVARSTCNGANHIWDIAEYGGMFFTAGYALSSSADWGETRMANAAPSAEQLRSYESSSTGIVIGGKKFFNVGQARKFNAFLSFDDDLFCFTENIGFKCHLDRYDWEQWRWNAASKKFEATYVPWSDIAPGFTPADTVITLYPEHDDAQMYDIMLSCCRKLGNRILYVLDGQKTNAGGHRRPWGAFSAVNVNHSVKATRLDLGGALPFDISICGDAAYIVASKGNASGSVVTNSIWKSEDGVNFTELAYFVTNRHATAVCRFGDDIYVGMGGLLNVSAQWPNLAKTPEISGYVFRVRLGGSGQGGGDTPDPPDPPEPPDPPAPQDDVWFAHDAATGALFGGSWDALGTAFVIDSPLTIDHVGVITNSLKVESSDEIPVASPEGGVASVAFLREGGSPVPWGWSARGWERLYGPSLVEGQHAVLVTTIGNGKVSYELEGAALTNAWGRSVFRTCGGQTGLCGLEFAAGEWDDFSGILREERMKRFRMVLR